MADKGMKKEENVVLWKIPEPHYYLHTLDKGKIPIDQVIIFTARIFTLKYVYEVLNFLVTVKLIRFYLKDKLS